MRVQLSSIYTWMNRQEEGVALVAQECGDCCPCPRFHHHRCSCYCETRVARSWKETELVMTVSLESWGSQTELSRLLQRQHANPRLPACHLLLWNPLFTGAPNLISYRRAIECMQPGKAVQINLQESPKLDDAADVRASCILSCLVSFDNAAACF